MIQDGSVKTNKIYDPNSNPTKSIKIRSSHSIFKVLLTIIIISQLCGYCWTKETKNKKLNVLDYNNAQRLELDKKLEDIGENFGVVKSEKRDLDIENQLFVVDAFIDSHRHVLSKRQVEEGSGESDDGGNTESESQENGTDENTNSETETGTNVEDETNNSNSDTTNESTNGDNSSASSFKTKSSIVSSFLAIFVYCYFFDKK